MTAPETAVLKGLQIYLTPYSAVPSSLEQVPATPDRIWVLQFNRADTDPLSRWGGGVLTLHTRGLPGVPLDVHDVADPLVGALNGLTGLALDGVTVNDCQHHGNSTGRDASKRSVRTDSFFLDLDYQA